MRVSTLAASLFCISGMFIMFFFSPAPCRHFLLLYCPVPKFVLRGLGPTEGALSFFQQDQGSRLSCAGQLIQVWITVKLTNAAAEDVVHLVLLCFCLFYLSSNFALSFCRLLLLEVAICPLEHRPLLLPLLCFGSSHSQLYFLFLLNPCKNSSGMLKACVPEPKNEGFAALTAS